MNKAEASNIVKTKAKELGFSGVGISRAELMEEEAHRLESWLENDLHGKMSYMANHFEKRIDPTKLVPGSKSVISLAYNYYNPEIQRDPNAPKISMYAYGKDYHFVIKEKLKILLEQLSGELGEIHGRCFVDSAPVMERDWAKRSGLGWIGKHTLLLNKKKGSYFFLAELIIDLELQPDHPISDHCGECTRCIDACPTEAISPKGYLLDASRCISYLTIELKEDIPEEFSGMLDDWMFGCDVCQHVCPWNRFSTFHSEPAFIPGRRLMEMDRKEWTEITLEVFNEIFKKSPVKRTRYAGLKRNINFLSRKKA